MPPTAPLSHHPRTLRGNGYARSFPFLCSFPPLSYRSCTIASWAKRLQAGAGIPTPPALPAPQRVQRRCCGPHQLPVPQGTHTPMTSGAAKLASASASAAAASCAAALQHTMRGQAIEDLMNGTRRCGAGERRLRPNQGAPAGGAGGRAATHPGILRTRPPQRRMRARALLKLRKGPIPATGTCAPGLPYSWAAAACAWLLAGRCTLGASDRTTKLHK